jgi:proteasome assembly chaperone (PAC2) family protein
MAKKNGPPANRNAILVAVWPGMGSVASTAGFYLMSKLKLKESTDWPNAGLVDPDHVEIQGGLIQPGKPPMGRFFEGEGPQNRRVVVVYLGEDQAPSSRGAICDRLLDFAEKAGVSEVFTFAALATDMELTSPSKVVGVSTDSVGLDALRREKIGLLEAGRISGLNGVFLAAAAKRGIRGVCLLGEVPAVVAHDPFPQAARQVLEAFFKLTGIKVDLAELIRYETSVHRRFKDVLERFHKTLGEESEASEEEEKATLPEPKPSVTPADRQRIFELLAQARKDRSKSFELKRELDRLGLFKEFEDRFLDLFRESA